MDNQELLNKIFTEHLIEMLRIYNETGEKLAKLKLKNSREGVR